MRVLYCFIKPPDAAIAHRVDVLVNEGFQDNGDRKGKVGSIPSVWNDAAGNQTNDTYTGEGTRTYDGENHLKTAWANNQWQTYTYDFNGRRIKRVVNGNETWQIYGMDGELLAEYKANAAAFLPTKEYGYRGGELLVTMASGDDARLSRFVTNLYYGALQRDPTSTELQNGINSLASAGATSYSSLLTAASSLARGLFLQTGYESSPYRSDAQFVADLYYAYLQRGPDDGGLGWWTSLVPGSGRANVCNAFEGSSEFQTLVSTLYGSATSDNQRTEQIVNNFYLGAYGRNATSTELQTQRDSLNNAAAQGLGQVQSQLETMGRGLFAGQVTDYSISDQQFVTNLYEGFLQRGPDAGGLGFWTSIAANGNRQTVLNAFATCGSFYQLAGTLYREEFWLVNDRLGTPRMIVDKSGSLASVRRHDYLPFGEEASGGQSRIPGLGYMSDTNRQKFTGYEYDGETGLNFAKARYQLPVQGRFTSVDPLGASANAMNPQSFNRYSYVGNDPTNAIDPSGLMLSDIGVYQTDDAEDATIEEHASLRRFQMTINDDYAARNGGTVAYDGNRATFTRLPSGSVIATVTIFGNFENVWGQPNFGAMANALRGLGGIRFGTQTDPGLEQRQAYYGTADGVPDEHVAHDNDDFRRVNVGIPTPLEPFGLSISFTWDKYGRKYLSLGPSLSVLPVSASWQTGRTFLNGENVKTSDGVQSVLMGSSISGEFCPLVCINGGYNVRSLDLNPFPPSGGATISSGVGLNAGLTREWTILHWGGRQ